MRQVKLSDSNRTLIFNSMGALNRLYSVPNSLFRLSAKGPEEKWNQLDQGYKGCY